MKPFKRDTSKTDRVLKLRREYEAHNTPWTAAAWIRAENELTPDEFDRYIADWRQGKA